MVGKSTRGCHAHWVEINDLDKLAVSACGRAAPMELEYFVDMNLNEIDESTLHACMLPYINSKSLPMLYTSLVITDCSRSVSVTDY